eukprot:GDKI01013200.1.p1 GENE.GDKI01013200.1~~GDKI01013200.1.p1  ORF type:complete len:177 (-),score=51.26 GDKI01013200.1:412-942(-)
MLTNPDLNTTLSARDTNALVAVGRSFVASQGLVPDLLRCAAEGVAGSGAEKALVERNAFRALRAVVLVGDAAIIRDNVGAMVRAVVDKLRALQLEAKHADLNACVIEGAFLLKTIQQSAVVTALRKLGETTVCPVFGACKQTLEAAPRNEDVDTARETLERLQAKAFPAQACCVCM